MSAETRLFRSDRLCLLFVLATALLLCATGLGRRDLWDPDEPRTAVATAGIVDTGEWSVLRQDGRIWLEKPPLYYWLGAGVSLAAGRVDELTLRLPANAAAVLCALGVFFIGRDFWGRRSGTLSAIVLLTTEDFVVESRWARPDMLLALLMTLAALCAWRAVRAEPHRGWLAGFWIAVGLAVLCKGPVGCLPLAGVVVFLAATRRLAALRRIGLVWGLPLAALPTMLWIAAWHDDAGRGFPLGEALARFGHRVAAGLHHPHPPVHLLTSLPLALMPWVVLLPAAVIETFPRGRRPPDDRAAFLYSLLIVYVMMFAMSVEKRGIYLLPILPLAALLVGRLWDLALFGWDSPQTGRAILAGILLWLAAVTVASAYYLPRVAALEADLLQPGRLLAACAFAGGLIPVILFKRSGAGRAIGVFSMGAAASALVVALGVMPALDSHKSARRLASEVAAAAGSGPIGIHPDAHAGISWYSRRQLVVLPDRAALAAFLAEPGRRLAVVEQGAWQVVERTEPVPGRVIGSETVGHRAFVLVRGGEGETGTTEGTP